MPWRSAEDLTQPISVTGNWSRRSAGREEYNRRDPLGALVKRKKRLYWYQHPLFGEASGRPPPPLTKEKARKIRSLDELRGTGGAGAGTERPGWVGGELV